MTADAQAQIAREDIDPKNLPSYSPTVQIPGRIPPWEQLAS
jgi:hypothetical protein